MTGTCSIKLQDLKQVSYKGAPTPLLEIQQEQDCYIMGMSIRHHDQNSLFKKQK